MTILDLLPVLDEVAPKPLTRLPATLVWLAIEEGYYSPEWGELRDRLASLWGMPTEDAEGLIVAALRVGDVRARLRGDRLRWEVQATPKAIRAVLLRYAVYRLSAADVDLDAPWLYREKDRLLVQAMVPDLDAIAHNSEHPKEPWQYRRLLEHPPTMKEI